jgi:hypothetical protein
MEQGKGAFICHKSTKSVYSELIEMEIILHVRINLVKNFKSMPEIISDVRIILLLI